MTDVPANPNAADKPADPSAVSASGSPEVAKGVTAAANVRDIGKTPAPVAGSAGVARPATAGVARPAAATKPAEPETKSEPEPEPHPEKTKAEVQGTLTEHSPGTPAGKIMHGGWVDKDAVRPDGLGKVKDDASKLG